MKAEIGESVSVGENPYEDVELVIRNVDRMKLDKTPPEPPPRNLILKPVKANIYGLVIFSLISY